MAELVVSSDLGQLPLVLDFVRVACEEAGMGEDDIFACELAADEACANIMEHAYDGSSVGDIRVECWSAGGQLFIRFHDTGRPFEPRAVTTPVFTDDLQEREIGGLGLHFMRSLMDAVTFDFSAAGNTLTMCKRIGG